MQAALIPGRRTALWLALAAVIFPSAALELGPAEVQSALGEKLDARIPLRAREGEWFHLKCLELTGEGLPGVPALAGGVLSVERRRTSTNLRIRSEEPVTEPALAVGITSRCAEAPRVLPPVTLLIDPPRVDRRAAPEPAAKGTASPRAARRIEAAPAQSAPLAIQEPSRAPAAPPRTKPPAEPAAPPASLPSAAPAAVAPAPPVPDAPAPARPETRARSGDFVLRLSSAPIDMGRSRQLDDKSRAVLRERLRLLDSDDQVAEMLSMRDNLRRLEARVAELQLKLAAMPQSFPAPAAREAAKPSIAAPAPAATLPAVAQPPATPASPQQAPATTPAPPREAPAATQPPPAVIAPADPPKAPAPAAAKPAAADQAPSAPAKAAPASAPAEESLLDTLQSFKGRVIGAGVAALVMLLMLGAWLWSRWRHPPQPEGSRGEPAGEATVLMEPGESSAAAEEPIEIAAPARVEVTSDATLATRLNEDTEALRKRYIEERFPEIKAGSIALDDPGSVVKGARLFYEDGALPRAVELLRFAVESRPAELRPWLALFEIYRLERLQGEYAELAARFRERHGETAQWAKVRSFGRELDPANPLYQDPPMKSLETIGPREARRMAAAQADPIAENWLEAPMDFENEVLATELRRSLMHRAKVDERDLVPNPMPALRSVEMFSVG